MKKAAFLDRDGVINNEVHYLHRIEDFVYTFRCKDALRSLNKAGFDICIITNQSGIARGLFTLEQYNELTDWLLSDLKNDGIEVLEIMHCPHHSYAILEEFRINCGFRKPNPGMINYLVAKYGFNLDASIIVGDKLSDIDAGRLAGVRSRFLVKTGHFHRHVSNQDFFVVDNLFSVSELMANGGDVSLIS